MLRSEFLGTVSEITDHDVTTCIMIQGTRIEIPSLEDQCHLSDKLVLGVSMNVFQFKRDPTS
jgi:hypothetical protein